MPVSGWTDDDDVSARLMDAAVSWRDVTLDGPPSLGWDENLPELNEILKRIASPKAA